MIEVQLADAGGDLHAGLLPAPAGALLRARARDVLHRMGSGWRDAGGGVARPSHHPAAHAAAVLDVAPVAHSSSLPPSRTLLLASPFASPRPSQRNPRTDAPLRVSGDGRWSTSWATTRTTHMGRPIRRPTATASSASSQKRSRAASDELRAAWRRYTRTS